MYIWLKQGTRKQVEALLESLQTEKRTLNLEVTSEGGQDHIVLHCFRLGPAEVFPDFLQEYVEKVTYLTTIDNPEGFRTEGLYRLNGAELTVHTRTSGNMNSEKVWQEVNISAPSYASLLKIYYALRRGDLVPKENWEAKQRQGKKWGFLARLFRC